MLDFDRLEESIESVSLKANELVFMRKENLNHQNTVVREISGLEKEIDILNKVSILYKHLIDTQLDKKKDKIEKLVTYGLRTVFPDQDLKFHINLEPKYNGISTTFDTEKVGEAKGNVLDSFGGGLVNVESFLLRIITLFQAKLSPFFFLDESFSHLSEEYVPNCGELLKKLCADLGITVFLITHQGLMLGSADKVYTASSKKGKMVVT